MLNEYQKNQLIEDTESMLERGSRDAQAKAIFASARLIADAIEGLTEQLKEQNRPKRQSLAPPAGK